MESKIHHSSPDDLVEVSGVMRQSHTRGSLSLLRTSALLFFCPVFFVIDSVTALFLCLNLCVTVFHSEDTPSVCLSYNRGHRATCGVAAVTETGMMSARGLLAFVTELHEPPFLQRQKMTVKMNKLIMHT